MMYSKLRTLNIRSSASLRCNNLSVLLDDGGSCSKIAVVHKSLVWLSDAKEKDLKSNESVNCQEIVCRGEGAHSSNAIMQAKWCILPERTILVIAAAKGAQMFDEDGSLMIFWQALAPNPVEGLPQFARGITTVGSCYICIGTADGSILVFDVPSRGTSVRLQETLTQHGSSSIADLASSDNQMMASSDDNGDVILWRPGLHFEVHCKVKGDGYPCSSLCFWKHVLIGGYGCGRIRLFDSSDGSKLAEICAHSRWVNAISVAPDSDMFLSVAEDTCLRLWKITEEPFNVESVYQDTIVSVQLCGAQFLDKGGSLFAISGYDSQNIHVYSRSQ